MSQPAIDIDALKRRQKATWMAGDFGLIARSYESGAAEFVRRLGLVPGIRVLDVACGTGNLAVPAARTRAEVTGVDIATNLLEQARVRAAAEGLSARFDEGDAAIQESAIACDRLASAACATAPAATGKISVRRKSWRALRLCVSHLSHAKAQSPQSCGKWCLVAAISRWVH